MTTYIAMLRGINVSGKNIIKMEELRALFEALGFAGVKTYVQSGNVVFVGKEESSSVLIKRLEKEILKGFGFSVPVMLKTSAQLAKVIKANPFLKEKGMDLSKLHVTFLAEIPANAGLEKMGKLSAKPDEFRALGEEIYLHCPNGYGRTKLSNNAIERMLGVGATTRNWKTVTQLLELSVATENTRNQC